MKKNLFSKIFTIFALAFTGTLLASCQKTNINEAKVVIVKESEANIYYNEADGKRYATATIGVENNTIYDVYTWNLTYTATYLDGSTYTETVESNMGVRHGAKGYVTFLEEVKDPTVIKVKITEGAPKKTLSVMQTYLGWWIAGFAVLLCSVIVFAFKLFQDTFTKEEAKQAFKEHIFSMLFGALLVLIIVMLPLILGSWVPTVILGGAALGSLVICGLLTGLKALTSKA